MHHDRKQFWDRFNRYYFQFPTLGLRTDLSRMNFDEEFLIQMEPRLQAAFDEMSALEAGSIANPDEGRMVGHYWLRSPSLSPNPQIRQAIEATLDRISSFTCEVHSGQLQGQHGPFKNLLVIGIGGSCLGPQFVASALGHPRENRMTPFFFDNTDSDGMERTLANIGEGLGQTLCIVVSKSGGTKETRNGMVEAMAAFRKAGLDFRKHAVAVTQEGSLLHQVSVEQGWLADFPMWDWVGGRTSQLSAVGLLPASLQGIDIQSIISGASDCDCITRCRDFAKNPAAQLALMWFSAGGGIGSKNMIILPYSDHLELFSKYLQQLVMESLGKSLSRSGAIVNQGISVFGNKGSTDQHSFIQQLRDGRNDYFATFIEVLRSRRPDSLKVEGEFESNDYLAGFYLGTRQALAENNRESVSVTIEEVTPRMVGVLIALFERAVGFYASLLNINAYNQPGVESGKKAAESALVLQAKITKFLSSNRQMDFRCYEIAIHLGEPGEVEHVFKICERLACNNHLARTSDGAPNDCKYSIRT